MKNYSITLILFVFILSGCELDMKQKNMTETQNNTAKVTLQKSEGKYQLLVNNNPFYLKGAGLEFGQIPALAKHNGNSFRTWRIDNGRQSGKEVLDEAHKYGLMVVMGIEVARERHGFDYNDSIAVKQQLERIRKEVIELKDHPALLMWGIGNELNLRYKNPKVWDAVNEISMMIHEVDSNHLTTTSLAGITKQEVDFIKERSPDLDLLSFQIYGKLAELPEMVKESGWEGAYMVTEWGPKGHWEVPKTSWGVPIEENSTVKAAGYLERYKAGIEADSIHCIGSFVFLWGQKQERTPTWYGLFLENGNETETVDIMHYLWNEEKWPENRTPQIVEFTLNQKTAYESVVLEKGKEYTAFIKIHDFNQDTISYKWEILAESTDLKDGGDYETRPETISVEIIEAAEGLLKFIAPGAGQYRLFVYANDGFKHCATANIPFLVK
ncbi:MAG: hypothetical protein JW729_05375 [Bacteroidales bacterium]|nr:hypothetical protein [Bacteroidales bacterium]